MFTLERLRLDHEAKVLAFELANRAYFAESISDRGDEFFREFPERHRASLAEQDAGSGAFYLLVDDEGAIVGRFNLYELCDETASVGFRVAQRVSGRGVATSALRDMCRLAGDVYGLRQLTAVASEENLASRRVLEKAGFVPIGPAEVAGRSGIAFTRPVG